MGEADRSKTAKSAYHQPGPNYSLDQSKYSSATNRTVLSLRNGTHSKMASKSMSTSTLSAQNEVSATNDVLVPVSVSAQEVTVPSFVTVQRTITTTYESTSTVLVQAEPTAQVTKQSTAQGTAQESAQATVQATTPDAVEGTTQGTAQETVHATYNAAVCSSVPCPSTSPVILSSQKTTSNTKSSIPTATSAKTSRPSTGPILLPTQNIASRGTNSSSSVPVTTTSESSASSTSSVVQSQPWTTIVTTPLGPGCLADNCLRALSRQGGIGASSFCSFYTMGLGPTTFPIYATMCGPLTSTSLFSACSCYNYVYISTPASATQLTVTYLPPFLPTVSPNPTSLFPETQIQPSNSSQHHLSKGAKAGIILGILVPIIVAAQIWLRIKRRRLLNSCGRNHNDDQKQNKPKPQPPSNDKQSRNSLICCCTTTTSSTTSLIAPIPPLPPLPPPPLSRLPRSLSILPNYDGPVYHPYSSSDPTTTRDRDRRSNGHIDENGIRWPERVVLKGESKEFHDWTRRYRKEQVAKMRLRNGGGEPSVGALLGSGMWTLSGEWDGLRKGDGGG